MRSTLRLAIVITVGTAWCAAASTLITTPFPGTLLSTGGAYCVVTNIGNDDAVVSTDLVDNFGVVLSHSDDTIASGQSRTPVNASFTNSNPTICRFDFKGKIRASFDYVNGGTVTSIPATK